jgi:glycosyltransferase involved in cell wall biosynthesis
MISVCIPTYNGERFIKQQLESILIQLGENDEVVISDDSSADSTVAIIREIDDSRIVLFENNTFRNPALNMENALIQASGDQIFLSDQDDLWMPGKVNIIMSYLRSYDLVLHDCEIIDENDFLLYSSFFDLNHSKRGFLKNLIKNSYIGCCMAFNRSIMKFFLPFPKNVPMHDLWIGLMAELSCNITFVPESLSRYRRHGMNATNLLISDSPMFKRIDYRMKLLMSLILRLFKYKR